MYTHPCIRVFSWVISLCGGYKAIGCISYRTSLSISWVPSLAGWVTRVFWVSNPEPMRCTRSPESTARAASPSLNVIAQFSRSNSVNTSRPAQRTVSYTESCPRGSRFYPVFVTRGAGPQSPKTSPANIKRLIHIQHLWMICITLHSSALVQSIVSFLFPSNNDDTDKYIVVD